MFILSYKIAKGNREKAVVTEFFRYHWRRKSFILWCGKRWFLYWWI